MNFNQIGVSLDGFAGHVKAFLQVDCRRVIGSALFIHFPFDILLLGPAAKWPLLCFTGSQIVDLLLGFVTFLISAALS